MEKGGRGEDETRVPSILEQAVENTNEAFVTIDEDHTVVFFNKAAEKIFGYTREEVIGRDLDLIMSPQCSKDHRLAVRRYVNTGVPRRIGHESEVIATRKNGESFPASISFSVTQVAGKLFFTGIIRDMTETRALRERIVRSERLAALGQLVAEITHEIKNPLVMIGGFARQLMRAVDDTQHLKKLGIITEEVRRLENLLADLRELYMIKTPASGPVNIREVLRGVLSLVKGECERKRIHTDLEVDEKALLVAGDRGRLEQVFLNLVKNAIEAMEHGGTISIAAMPSGDQVEITVADEGSGIPEENREKIFSPFFTTKSHGTGLGLSITKQIIEEHPASSLSVGDGEGKGKGTTFTIRLPAYRG